MYNEIAANKRKTVMMMIFFVVMFGGLGWLLGEIMGDPALTPYVLIGASVYAVMSYMASSRVALAVNGAKEIQKKDNPRLWRIVENLAITEGLPMPRVYIVDDPAPNAFATGRDPKNASVAATTGLLDMMTDAELQGVMAHEIGHVKNYDIRVAMIVFALAAAISLLVDVILRYVWFRDNDDTSSVYYALGLFAAVLAPLVALIIQASISRKREYLADATGVMTTRYPEALASALEKIGGKGSALKRQNASTAHLFFANPLRGKGITNLFSTHPPIEDRVVKLRSMGFDH